MPVNMKLMISSAFVQMTQTQNIDKITVKDLVARCGISRQAFYYHFQDILEVMEWSIRQILQQALQNSLHMEHPEKAIAQFVAVTIENKDLLTRLLSSQRRAQLEHIYVDALRSCIRQMIYGKKPDMAIPHQDLEIALNFYAYGIAGAVFEDCRNQETNVEQLSRKLYQLICGSLIQ